MQAPCHAGRLTVLLDLDGTLISSFTPRRAPALPRSMVTHLVGVGSSLNPAGVFVVERPGLRRFLQQLASLAEVVVFTAGACGCVSGCCGCCGCLVAVVAAGQPDEPCVCVYVPRPSLPA
jgi:hypothetical protein